MAKVIFTGGFTLLCDDGRRFEFAPGEQEIPDELADHWYVKAHCEPLSVAYDVPEVAPADEPAAEAAPVVEKRKPGRPRSS